MAGYSRWDSRPMNEVVSVFHNDDFILFQHRQQDVLQFALPKFPFVKLCLHRLTRREVGETAHEKEGVGIFDGGKRAQYFHPDFSVCRNRLGAEYLEELRAPAGLGFIRAHFDDHLESPPSTRARLS